MKTYWILLSLFFSEAAIGQQHSLSINYKPSLTYFGQQTQSFHHYYFHSRSGDKTFNNTVNILYGYKLSSKIKITTGLEYAQQGQNISFIADSAFPSSNKKNLVIELNYFRIPLTIEYSIFKIKKSELKIYSGVSFGIATKRSDNYQYIILENILLPPAEKRYKNQNWAIPIGINYERALTRKTNAILGGEYLSGLTNSFTENGAFQFGVLSEFDNSRQKRISLSFGIGINLKK